MVLYICTDITMALPLLGTSLTIAGRGSCEILPFVQMQLIALPS